jgi:hypothetical protein
MSIITYSNRKSNQRKWSLNRLLLTKKQNKVQIKKAVEAAMV